MSEINLDYLQKLDQTDPLAHLRDLFTLPDGVIYLDGNSLGALPKHTPARLQAVITEQWGQSLIRSWNSHNWMQKPVQLGDRLGQLVGAEKGQSLVCDSTSVNIFKLAAAAIRLRPTRCKVITETGNFATDLYLLQGLERMLGKQIQVVAVPREEVTAQIDQDTALVLLTHTHYKSGQLWDMEAITTLTHQQGALILWDLSHSLGAMPVHLDKYQADFAVGCNYKYINGGPGAPALLYVAKRHQAALEQPLTGWLGHARPFDFVDQYQAAPGIEQAMCGTPPVLANAALECALEIMEQADLQALRRKSLQLGNIFIQLIAQYCPEFELVSPTDETQRGSQVSITHPQGYAIMQNLIERQIIGDFRAPDNLRFGFAPLYIRYVDMWHTVQTLADIMATGSWQEARFRQRQQVT
ncbi:MAG: kynureninase [Gammaproteobacteria bacterium]|jgi:kynureninase|nr:kynureninase [Gammaproteobacteria bacterium]